MRLGYLRFALYMLLVVACASHAQTSPKSARVGHLGHGLDPSGMNALRASLQDLGLVLGKNIEFTYRYAERSAEELPQLAAELAALNVDVIVANGTPAARAAQRATTKVPVVMVGIGGDPVQLGLVRTLSHPGGNVTGIAALGTELWGKRLELFREAIPKASRLAVLWNPGNPGNVMALKEIEAVAPQAGMRLSSAQARHEGELSRAFAVLAKEQPHGLVIIWDAFLVAQARRIADFAAKERIPTLGAVKEYVQAGALMSYGANVPDQWRRAAHYIDKILKGAKPADLPVEQPTKFDFALNVGTARTLGLQLPPALVLRADDVIH